MSGAKKKMTDANLPPFRELANPSAAVRVRRAVLDGLHAAGGGHYGGCSSCVELLLALFASRPLACGGTQGDRLLLSKGHASMTLYAILSMIGADVGPLAAFGSQGSPLQGHPDRQHLSLMDFSFGSLGQGVAVGLGMALAPFRGTFAVADRRRQVWVVLGDGECQEGMVWEAAALAARYRVGNLHVLIDANGQQECGWGHDLSLEQSPLPADLQKWSAFGWSVQAVDGHDISAIQACLDAMEQGSGRGQPTALILRTRKQLDASFHLAGSRAHHTRLSDAEYRALRQALGRDD